MLRLSKMSQKHKPSIAGVILTLNEQQNLARALCSLSWCDELLVVDSGSADSTREIAEYYGAKFVTHIQPPPFVISEQRNWALDFAGIASEWVLFLDADEEVCALLATQIRTCIGSNLHADAYELAPRYWFLGKWLRFSQGFPCWHPRLLKLGAARFDGGVWESFAPGSRVSRINTPYEHYAFSKGFDDWLERHSRYSSWDAEQIVAFLATRNTATLATRRWRTIRLFLSQFWWLRPPLRFLQKYVLQFGFLEGWQGLLFALMMAGYEMMTVIKVIELLRRQKNLML